MRASWCQRVDFTDKYLFSYERVSFSRLNLAVFNLVSRSTKHSPEITQGHAPPDRETSPGRTPGCRAAACWAELP